MGAQDQIQTNVDKLVSLVQEYGKITYKEAAKKLALPVETIEQWAHILESENVIELKFGFGSPTMIKKELTDKQVKERIAEFREEKDLFSKKLESAESYFNELDKKILNVVDIMKDMEGSVDKKLSEVNDELTDLKIAEEKKEALDKRILESKHSSQQKLLEVEEHINKLKENYETSYEQTKKELTTDEELFEKSQKFLDKVREQELVLQQRLAEVKALSSTIQSDVISRSKKLEETQDRVSAMRKKHDELRAELEEEHRNLKELIASNETQEKEVTRLQKSIYDKMVAEEDDLTRKEADIRVFPQKFKELAAHKNDIHELLNVISHEEIELRAEIEALKKQSKVLEASQGTAKYQLELEHLNDRMNTITAKRSFFKTKIEQLTHMLDWSSKRGVAKLPSVADDRMPAAQVSTKQFVSQQPQVTSRTQPITRTTNSQSKSLQSIKKRAVVTKKTSVKGNAKKGNSKGSRTKK